MSNAFSLEAIVGSSAGGAGSLFYSFKCYLASRSCRWSLWPYKESHGPLLLELDSETRLCSARRDH